MDEVLVSAWRKMERKLIKHIPRYKAYEMIGQKYGISWSTVYYWLDPTYRIRALEKKKEYRRRPEVKLRMKRYQKEYAREPRTISMRKEYWKENKLKSRRKEQIASYDLWYKRLIRHLDYFVLHNFGGNGGVFSSGDVSDVVRDRTGVRLHAETIEKILDKYDGSADSSIVRAGERLYRVDGSSAKH